MKVSIKEVDNSTNFFTRDKIDDNVVEWPINPLEKKLHQKNFSSLVLSFINGQ